MRSTITLSTLIVAAGLPVFADDPTGTTCPIVHQQLQNSDYQIIIFGDILKARGVEIEQALVSTKNEYINRIGDVKFVVSPIESNVALNNVYVLCQLGACDHDIAQDRTIMIEYGEGLESRSGFLKASDHIARATIGRIQAIENAIEINGPGVLTLEHMLGE